VKKHKNSEELKAWFYSKFWNGKPRISEVSGDLIGWKFSTLYYHHILPKNKYPEFEFLEENIAILTPEEHQKIEAKTYKYESINKKREELLKKYDEITNINNRKT